MADLFSPAPADRDAFDADLDALAGVLTPEAPDLVGVQEIGDVDALTALLDRLGGGWAGTLSTHVEPRHATRVGWRSRRPLTDVEEVVDLPRRLPPVTVDDGTTLTRAGRGALAVTTPTADGVAVRAVCAHLPSPLLSFPGGRLDTRDEGERARSGSCALTRRAAEAAARAHGRPPDRPERRPAAGGVRRPQRHPGRGHDPACCTAHRGGTGCHDHSDRSDRGDASACGPPAAR